jgi:hypothetical protein
MAAIVSPLTTAYTPAPTCFGQRYDIRERSLGLDRKLYKPRPFNRYKLCNNISTSVEVDLDWDKTRAGIGVAALDPSTIRGVYGPKAKPRISSQLSPYPFLFRLVSEYSTEGLVLVLAACIRKCRTIQLVRFIYLQI